MKKRILTGLIVLLLFSVIAVPVYAAENTLAVQNDIFQYLTQELEIPMSAACGIMANIEQESGFDPSALGDNGTSFGLCQWHNVRFVALRSYCQGKGMDYRSVEGQLSFLGYELAYSYIGLYNTLQALADTPQSAYLAGYLWCTDFERPADMERKAVARGNLAKGKYWSRYSALDFSQQVEEDVLTFDELWANLQREVTIPQPPEKEPERFRQQAKINIRYYTPSHLPPTYVPDPAAAFACAILFMPLVWQEKRGIWVEMEESYD